MCLTHGWGQDVDSGTSGQAVTQLTGTTAHSHAVMGLFGVVAVLEPDRRTLALAVGCFRWRNGVKYLGSLSVLLRNVSRGSRNREKSSPGLGQCCSRRLWDVAVWVHS